MQGTLTSYETGSTGRVSYTLAGGHRPITFPSATELVFLRSGFTRTDLGEIWPLVASNVGQPSRGIRLCILSKPEIQFLDEFWRVL